MVQDFHVVKCFKCENFQVQQVKKVNRWSCKVCGEKQTLLKEYGRGSGADCRRHVQKMNAMKGAMMEEQEHNTWSLWEQDKAEPEEERDDQTQVSRWSKYLDPPEEAGLEEEQEKVLMDRQQLHGNNVTDRKRKRRDAAEQIFSPTRTHGEPIKTRTTSLNQSRTTSEKKVHPPDVSSGPVSRWPLFLSSDCQVQNGEKPSVSGWTRQVGGATSLPCGDIITSSRPLLPVSSLFETEEDFSFEI
ncbi:MRN complex-interacting protein isoform X2 [Scophthalmus maximus]|uniref:MRN complex-interacting protein isoform X2 n=1 Tax=Scophthalmus maximus TaxID=52904 RepID=UPI001FA90E0B|nr:MRN complex-interacting protein isoform X2 [Scophthalmus maximus]